MTGPTANTPNLQTYVVWARVLMLLTALVIAIMPWTEYWWHFDQFLRGGQDLELSLLSLVVFFCLVLVLFRHGNGWKPLMLPFRRLAFQHADPGAPGALPGLIATLHAVPLPSPSLSMSNLPIQV
jgi:hypothetical protein